MRKLSQKAWNNVLIFSMLILIVVLNYETLFGSNQSNTRALIPQGQFILSLQINQISFERIGEGWRVSAPSEDLLPDMQSEDIQSLISTWQKVVIRKSASMLPDAATSSPQYLVSLWLAGNDTATVLGLLEHESIQYMIYQGELYELDFPLMRQLLPTKREQA